MIIQYFFLSILSKQVEHNKCPFLTQKVLVDLSISFLQIKHLNIGGINKIQFFLNFINISLFFLSQTRDQYFQQIISSSLKKKDLQFAGLLVCVRFLN